MMPILLPTPDELADLDWHKRDKAVRAARALLRGYGVHVEPADRVRWREGRERYAARHAAWAESVRAEARRLAGEGA
jgi:hypothetical protein